MPQEELNEGISPTAKRVKPEISELSGKGGSNDSWKKVLTVKREQLHVSHRGLFKKVIGKPSEELLQREDKTKADGDCAAPKEQYYNPNEHLKSMGDKKYKPLIPVYIPTPISNSKSRFPCTKPKSFSCTPSRNVAAGSNLPKQSGSASIASQKPADNTIDSDAAPAEPWSRKPVKFKISGPSLTRSSFSSADQKSDVCESAGPDSSSGTDLSGNVSHALTREVARSGTHVSTTRSYDSSKVTSCSKITAKPVTTSPDVGVSQETSGTRRASLSAQDSPQNTLSVSLAPQGLVGGSAPQGVAQTPQGVVHAPQGSSFLPPGSVSSPQGFIQAQAMAPQGLPHTPQGSPFLPQGSIQAQRTPQGFRAMAPQGLTHTPLGLSFSPQGPVGLPQGSLLAQATPQGFRTMAPQGLTHAPEGSPFSPQGQVRSPQGQVRAPQGPSQAQELTTQDYQNSESADNLERKKKVEKWLSSMPQDAVSVQGTSF